MTALTIEQQGISDAPAENHLLVTAGPGTGKTHTLAHRIARLVTRDDVAPGSEVLLLTFSRAAVGELRRRLGEMDGSARWVRALTFDSFATRALAEVEPDGPWIHERYDGRIRAIVDALKKGDAMRVVSDIRHVVVDELQDVVGPRADLVYTLLDTLGCGWTLFGDPAQAIYDFQDDGGARRDRSLDLYRRLRARFEDSLEERTLTRNFRTTQVEAEAGLWAGPELNASTPNHDDLHSRLMTTVYALPSTPPLSVLPRLGGSVGILSPFNGHSLLLSRELWERGVPHRVRRSATDRAVPAWVAQILRGIQGASIGKDAFTQAAARARTDEHPSPDEAWRLLRRLDPGSRNVPLHLDRIASKIRSGNLPDELVQDQTAEITVSTIHRSKGLEYDHVLVVPAEPPRDDEDLGEQARLIYVALSRAREDLFRMRSPDMTGMTTRARAINGRWLRHGFKRYHLHAFEVRPGDSENFTPAGDQLPELQDASAEALQTYIGSEVHHGDPVELRLVPGTAGLYGISHETTIVGVTTEAFSSDLGQALYGPEKNWPIAIRQLRIEGVDSVAGDPDGAARAEIGGAAVWLRARVQGLGELEFAGTRK